jgi:hypothetical protein
VISIGFAYVETAQDYTITAENLVLGLNVDVTSNRLSSFASIDWAEGSSSWGQLQLASVPLWVGSNCRFRVSASADGVDTETPRSPFFPLPFFS